MLVETKSTFSAVCPTCDVFGVNGQESNGDAEVNCVDGVVHGVDILVQLLRKDGFKLLGNIVGVEETGVG